MKLCFVQRALNAGTRRSTCKLCGKEEYVCYSADDNFIIMGCDTCRRGLATSYKNQLAWQNFMKTTLVPFYVFESVEMKEDD